MYKAFECWVTICPESAGNIVNYNYKPLDRMVKAAKINIINANVRNNQTR